MDIELVKVEKPAEINFILGQSHFIKTVEDVYEAMVNSSPGVKFGVAFCEASGDRLVRFDGNDKDMTELAKKNAKAIACGHTFIVFMKDGYPVNFLRAIQNTPEVCHIICASANDVQVVVARSEQGRGILGVIDGQPPLGVETEADQKKRKDFLRMIGYKR